MSDTTSWEERFITFSIEQERKLILEGENDLIAGWQRCLDETVIPALGIPPSYLEDRASNYDAAKAARDLYFLRYQRRHER